MSQSDNRLHLRYGVIRNVRTKHRRGAFHMPPLYGISFQQRGGALLSLPCVRGGAALPRGGGVVPDKSYLLFLFCKLYTFTIPQELPRQLPLHKGAFLGLCEHCKLTCGASWAPPPTGFVRTSRETFCRRGRRLQCTVCLAKIQPRRGAFHMPPPV